MRRPSKSLQLTFTNMPKKTSKDMDLKSLLIQKLQALYDIENEIIKALPKLAKKAKHSELKQALEEHLEQTRGHAERLIKAFDILGEKPKKLKVEGIRGIIEDGDWVAKNIPQPALDANLIAAAQYVEHYEMAGYGTAAEWAEELGEMEIKELMGQTLEEEKAADEKLNALAKTKINEKVLQLS
jgi:ferritin-like metal-binding protein YciE